MWANNTISHGVLSTVESSLGGLGAVERERIASAVSAIVHKIGKNYEHEISTMAETLTSVLATIYSFISGEYIVTLTCAVMYI